MAKNKINNLTKRDISIKVSNICGFPNSLSSSFLDNFFSIAINSLIKKKKIKFKNIGSFKIKTKKKRIGRNPKTNEKIEVSQRNVVLFKVSKSLYNKINK